MSETVPPLQGQTVEDVLSSIRRLVQEEERQRRRPSAEPESLILTSEMRVEETPTLPLSPLPDSREALIELIRIVVREELSGELGDRISSNIRKLVRREINRVLTARMAE